MKKNAVMTIRVQEWVKEFYEDKENIRPAEALEFFALLESPTDFLKCRLNRLEQLKDEAEIELAKINSEYDFLDKKLSLITNTNNFFQCHDFFCHRVDIFLKMRYLCMILGKIVLYAHFGGRDFCL